MATFIRSQVIFDAHRISGVEDVRVCTFDQHFPTLVGDWTLYANSIQTMLSALTTRFSSFLKPREVRFYRPIEQPIPGGAPVATRPLSPTTFSAGSGMLPPQVACSVTEITSMRKHWGRFYLPAPAVGVLALDGSYSTSFTIAVADAVLAHYNRLTAAGIEPCVLSRVRRPGLISMANHSVWAHLPVQQIRVDTVPDVIRSRRFEQVSDRQTRNVTPVTP